MGMFSEANAEATAKKLEAIILKGMNDPRWGDVLQGFVKQELVEWYYDECGETWGGYKAHPDIEEMFPPKEE